MLITMLFYENELQCPYVLHHQPCSSLYIRIVRVVDSSVFKKSLPPAANCPNGEVWRSKSQWPMAVRCAIKFAWWQRPVMGRSMCVVPLIMPPPV